MDAIFDEEVPRARLAVLLKHFSQIDDDREPWRVVYPLAEVLLLLTCHHRLVRRLRRYRCMGQTSSRFSASVLGVSFRHLLRALASDIGQSR
jgi:hypothetical protein